MVSDFGTNAEIALVVNKEVYTCSAVSSPAIEGQTIKKRRLASTGTICNLKSLGSNYGWKKIILNENLIATDGNTIDLSNGKIILNSEKNIEALSITGTGVIAAFSLGTDENLLAYSKIKTPDEKIHLQNELYLEENT